MSINFFTPIVHKDAPTLNSRSRQRVDNYFYLGGKKAYVIGQSKDGKDKVVISKSHASNLGIAIKLLSYTTIVIPLIMLATKAILRSQLNYKIIDPKEKLEKGINISDEQIGKINTLLPFISSGQKHEDIEWLEQGQQNLVFRLKIDPTIVYKFSRHELNDKRYENMVKAKAVCLANQLGLLVIPSSTMIQVGEHKLIAEECMDINFNGNAQEALYHKCSADLNKTVKQLATLIARTGLNDVAWRNVPILNEKDGFQGPRRVALVDLEHMESVIVGFIGGANNSRGLIKCVTKDQIDIVIKQGRKKGASLSSSTIKQAKKERKTEIKENLKMTTFYEEKGFKTGKELLQVDIHSLGLNLDETALDSSNRTVTLREVAESILDEINKHLENGSEEATIIRNRNILINTNLATCTCSPYRHIGLRKDGVKDSEQTWVRQIMRALVENQHVYKFIADNSYGIHIQA